MTALKVQSYSERSMIVFDATTRTSFVQQTFREKVFLCGLCDLCGKGIL